MNLIQQIKNRLSYPHRTVTLWLQDGTKLVTRVNHAGAILSIKEQRYRLDRGYIGHRIKPGWKGSLPFYRFQCPKHGLVENYPMGYEEILHCPECDKEEYRATTTHAETDI